MDDSVNHRVRLVGHTVFATGQRDDTVSDFVVWCARVSNPESQAAGHGNFRLLQYLRDHRHWSPFEMANMVLEIQTTRDIARQILRHRSFSFQEFSQRYSEVPDAAIVREARDQDPKNRQASLRTTDELLKAEWAERQETLWEQSREAYNWALDRGIAKEQARAVLPEGLTRSTILVNGTIRSWLHYVAVRAQPDTQAEHRAIAIDCAKILDHVLYGDSVP